MSRDAFGPNLSRIRVQKGISLYQIAEATKVSAALWSGLERNDFSHWPTGIFARAYVRQYASAIGLDPEATVDEFCRWFPQGDRRAECLVRGHAKIVGHDLAWNDEVPRAVSDTNRRGMAAAPPMPAARPIPPSPFAALLGRLRRTLGKA